jgi:hypothetical protein
MAHCLQRSVGGCDQVASGIRERSVEVEDHGALHALSPAFARRIGDDPRMS